MKRGKVALTDGGISAAAAPTWIASNGCPGAYPFLPSPPTKYKQFASEMPFVFFSSLPLCELTNWSHSRVGWRNSQNLVVDSCKAG